MRQILHRGNIDGPSKFENDPARIREVIGLYDCEVDVWEDFKGGLYLGHDRGDHPVHPDFFYNYQTKLWCHAKNLRALETLMSMDMNCFYHAFDSYTLTYHGFIWTAMPTGFSGRMVVVDTAPDWEQKMYNVFGVCVDYVK